MKTRMKNDFFKRWQAVAAVLLFVFIAVSAQANIADDLQSGKTLRDAVADSLADGVTIPDLTVELVGADVSGYDIISILFGAGLDKVQVITAALDSGLGSSEVAGWAHDNGATLEEIQQAYKMSGESLPPGFVFIEAQQFEDSAKEYLYRSPSQSN